MTVSTPSCPTCVCGRSQGDIVLPNGKLAGTINKFRVKQQVDGALRGDELVNIFKDHYGYDITQVINEGRGLRNGEFLGVCQNVLSVTNNKIRILMPRDPNEFLQSNQAWNGHDHQKLLTEEVE